MIQGKNFFFLEIPRCGTSIVGDILLEQCGGFRITPRHDTLAEKPENTTVFTIIRKPYTRMQSMYHYFNEDAKEGGLIEWYEWCKTRSDPFHICRPYTFWTSFCDKTLKMEKLEEDFVPFMSKLGHKIELPEIVETDYTKTTVEEADYIKTERKSDFVNHGYKFDRRSKI